MNITIELNLAKNIFGKLDIVLRRRIIHYVMNPTFNGWDDISSIVINSDRFFTIWQAVLEVDPTFPKYGRTKDVKGKVVREWEKIPSPETIKKALFYATH